VARATKVGEDPRVGRSGLRRPAGQLDPCKVFRPGEEGKVQWAELGQKAGWTGRADELAREKFSKKWSWAATDTGLN
jgi:hypothetical protein